MGTIKKCISYLLVFVLLLGTLSSHGETAAAAGKLKVSTKKVTLKEGQSKKVTVKNAPGGAKCKWSSRNKKIARVSQKGRITGVRQGQTKVACKVSYRKKGKRKSAKFLVSVKVQPAGTGNSPDVATPTQEAAPTGNVTAAPVPTGNETAAPAPAENATEVPAQPELPVPTGTILPDNPILTSDELIEDMGAGWNLGNTMDGHTGFTPGETVWQHVKTTKALIKAVHDLGFNTVRIPVTWGTMIDDDNDYAIDEKWMSRVQDIADYCISQDMYVIINIHHDGAEQTGWLRIATEDQEGLEEKFGGVWKHIAETFRDYDEHLILESMNEVQGVNMTVAEENAVIMKLNQIFVDTVRASGSFNEQRWLMMPGKYNYIDSVCNKKNAFSLPEDTVENRLIVSIHDYSPWSFCGSESTSRKECTEKMLTANDKELKPLYDTYTSQGIPVVVGEYGCINAGNPEERAQYLEAMNRMFRKYKLVGVYWDQGWYDRTKEPDYSFTIIDRQTGEPVEKPVTDGLLRGSLGLSGETDPLTVAKPPTVVPVTQLRASCEQIELKLGEKAEVGVSYGPAETNDVLLWKTADPSVATVAYGTIHAKGIGTTTVTLYSQHSDVTVDIPVTVAEREATVPCGTISTSQQSYTLEQEETAWLDTQLLPAGCDDEAWYRSDDEGVVTVSSIGKLVAVGAGSATVTVGTASGKVTSVPVTVQKAQVQKDIHLAVNVYYNDSVHKYYSNEVAGDVITVTGDGQYTLSFDCQSDLSEAAMAAGVSSLNRVMAIYIKENAAAGDDSPLSECQIRYDKIEVDGTELPVTKTGFKSALKDSGIFDTNDPINGWDGSAVEGVSASGNVASFTGMSDPQKITITFTLEGMKFKEE